MASSNTSKDKFFEKVINPYLAEVLHRPKTMELHEGVLHIRDVEGPRRTGSVETRLEAMEQQVFKCQGMVERVLDANHMMISELANNLKQRLNGVRAALEGGDVLERRPNGLLGLVDRARQGVAGSQLDQKVKILVLGDHLCQCLLEQHLKSH